MSADEDLSEGEQGLAGNLIRVHCRQLLVLLKAVAGSGSSEGNPLFDSFTSHIETFAELNQAAPELFAGLDRFFDCAKEDKL